MKNILCYGDSLTFGHSPVDGTRHPFEDRWPTTLGAALGTDKVRIVAEGLGGRTTAFDDHTMIDDRNGVRTLPTILGSHVPLDLVVIMLGTNDMKEYLNGSAFGAAMGMRRLVDIIRTFPYNMNGPAPRVILVSPPLCVPTDHVYLSHMFEKGLEQSKLLAGHYARVAEEFGCGFFDAATVAKASPLDGVHLDQENTRAIGTALAPVVAKILEM